MALSAKASNRIIWGVRILLAVAYTAAATAKLTGAPMMVENFDHLGLGQWFRYVTACVELLGVILLLVPSTGLFGGLLLGGTMVCAVAAHLFVIGGTPIPAIILGLLCASVVYHLRPASGPFALSKRASSAGGQAA